MKKIFFLFLLIGMILSCSEGNKKTDAVAETTTDMVVDDAVRKSESVIPLYNYSKLERDFLNKKEDVIYVINFWATWCKPCVKELPAFEKLQTEYQDRNVEVVLVSLDFPDHIESRVLPFMVEHDLKSKVLILDDPDANSWIPAVDEQWSGAIPATVIVKNGARKFYERSFTYEELENELNTIL